LAILKFTQPGYCFISLSVPRCAVEDVSVDILYNF